MTVVIELPDNQHATLKTSEELSNKEVKLLRRAARKVGLVGQHLKDLGLDELSRNESATDGEEPDAATTDAKNSKALAILTQISDTEDDDLDLFQRTCAAVRLVEWTLDLPLPKTPEDVDNLARPVYEALTTEAAKLDLNESFTKEADLEAPKAEVTEVPQPTEDSNA